MSASSISNQSAALWTQTAAPFPDACLHTLFQAVAARLPDKIAVVAGEVRWSYAELDQRANRLARKLQALGVGTETLVGLYVDRDQDMLLGMLGIFKAGGAYVPLDPIYPPERLGMILEDAACPVILTQEALQDALPAGNATLIRLDADWPEIEKLDDTPPPCATEPQHLAYTIFTSGTTGRPKGVQIEHRALVNFLEHMARVPRFTEDDVILNVTTPSFDISTVELLLPLYTGATTHIAPRDVIIDGVRLAKLMIDCGATVMQATPSTWKLLLHTGWEGQPALRIWCGGEALPRDLANRLVDCGAELWNLYGPTEATVWATTGRIAEKLDSAVYVGHPVQNYEIHILDEQLQPVAPGETGELLIGGVSLARGYLKRPELTAEKFIPHPFKPADSGERLYRTGDLARFLPGDRLEVLGRIDHQVKVRGYRIELNEIEAVLNEHPAVRESVTVADDDGTGEKRLVAYVVLDPEGAPAAVEAAEGAKKSDAALDAGRVDNWQAIWDQAYSAEPGDADPAFNVAGWNSSYTGKPIPREQMRVWLDTTIERIKALKPDRLFEIGCGTGMMLFNLAGDCSKYFATDLTATALEGIRRHLARPEYARPSVELTQRPADNFSGIKDGSFDTAVLNSVIQYFPDIGYLAKVLEGSARAVAPGGHIWVGDVRSYPLLEAYHASVVLHKADDDTPRDELRRRIARALGAEEELTVDPAFFFALAQRFDAISGVRVLPKRGDFENELTLFRYDVVLEIGPRAPTGDDITVRSWRDEGIDLAAWTTTQKDAAQDRTACASIPNARVERVTRLVALLNDEKGPTTAGALRTALKDTPSDACARGATPDELWSAGSTAGLRVAVQWPRHETDGGLDACVQSDEAAAEGADWPAALKRALEPQADHAYANHPLREKITRKLAPALRKHLQAKLPDYMVPAIFESLDRLPLNYNGKIDRNALPPPVQTRTGLDGDYLAPRNALESYLAEAWQEILGLEKVGVRDDFFALGGESMKTAVLTNQLRDKLEEVVFPTVLFDAPTIEQLATYLHELFPNAVARVFGLDAEAVGATTAEPVDLARAAMFRELITPLGPPPKDTPAHKNKRAIFLLTAPRCGSTLLRVMLGGHSKLFAPPEQELLNFNTLGERAAELTGKHAGWREGTLRAIMDLKGCDADAARAMMEEREARNLPTKAFFAELQDWLGDRILVDKTASYALDMETLHRAEADFEEPIYIHLVRHPAAMIHSFEKAQLQQVWFQAKHEYAPRELAELVWLVSQQNIADFLKDKTEKRTYRVQFEELVKDPRPVLEGLCKTIGLPFEEEMLRPYANQDRKMTDGLHRESMMLGDQKFQQFKTVDARVADAWRREGSGSALGEITREVAAHLGYQGASAISKNTCLVPIKKSGAKNPLFAVHPGGGSLLAYGTLVKYFDPDRPLYGLQARGLTDDEDPHTQIPDMARYYIEEIQKIQPTGPYLIGGRCLGGYVAFEMAQQLTAAGEEVSFLGLWDPMHAPPLIAGEKPVAPEGRDDFLREAGRGHGKQAKPSRMQRKLRKLKKRVTDWFEYLRMTPEEQRLQDFKRIHRQARKKYATKVYPGKISLWRNGRMDARTRHEIRWEALAAQGLDVHVINAGHFAMFREPHVKQLAEQLNACMAELA